jgi:hypothetical protein
MKKFQNLIADLKRINENYGSDRNEWFLSKLEPLVEEAIREQNADKGNIRGLNEKIRKMEMKLEAMERQVKKVRAVIPFCPRCDQPFCNMGCR